jgi:hypothetical protein
MNQCARAAFDGLLPDPHDGILMALLQSCAEWHALAKLRMHTEETLSLLETQTTILAARFERFIDTTCSFYDTKETNKEQRARLRRSAKNTRTRRQASGAVNRPGPSPQAELQPPPAVASGTAASATEPGTSSRAGPAPCIALAPGTAEANTEPGPPSQAEPEPPAPPTALVPSLAELTNGPNLPPQAVLEPPAPPNAPTLGFGTSVENHSGRLKKSLSIATYKYHALGDYANTIRQFGTTDSYTSERVGHSLSSCETMLTSSRANWSIRYLSHGIFELTRRHIRSRWPRSSAGKQIMEGSGEACNPSFGPTSQRLRLRWGSHTLLGHPSALQSHSLN